MSSTDSPFFHWDPTSPGWLLRKAAEGEPISRAEVSLVIRANPDLEPHPILYELMIRTISGELKGKRGAKPKLWTAFREYAAIELYQYYLPRIRDLRRRARKAGWQRARSDMSSTELAHALVARRLGYKDEAVVRNLLSKSKNKEIGVRYNPDDI